MRDLGDGLILRRAEPADTERLAEFNKAVHEDGDPPELLMSWVRDLMSGRHPTFKPEDFTIVEDTGSGQIVSSLNLISQKWLYGGIEFGVGRPELVGTLPAYRKRGLVRAQFDVIHEWSRQRGELVQAITGIPYFYRQFGYDMALDLDTSRGLPVSAVPELKRGEKEPFRLRPVKEADLTFVTETYRDGMKRYLLSCVRDRTMWRYDLTGRTMKDQLRVIEHGGGKRVGFLVHFGRRWGDTLNTAVYELRPGVNWLRATPSVVRYLAKVGGEYAAKAEKKLQWLRFGLGTEHPSYQASPLDRVRTDRGWAFYMRVPGLPAFLRHIAPVLQARLAESVAVGHTGELKLSFYRSGLRLELRKGKLARVEAWEPDGSASAGFPNLTFLQLLFGFRSLEELQHAYMDCTVNGNEPWVLLTTLFPKKASQVWPLQ
jgi:hypothetical protein